MLRRIRYWFIKKLAMDDFILINGYWRGLPLSNSHNGIDEQVFGTKYNDQRMFVLQCYVCSLSKKPAIKLEGFITKVRSRII